MKRRGAALVLVLLLLTVLLTLGVAILTSQSLRYQGAVAARDAALALALAEAGMEDARVKLQKDLEFPPQGAPEQRVFTYTEELGELGAYVVTLDATWAAPPRQVLLVRSTGTLRGARGASQTILGELDLATHLRSDSTVVNPLCREWLNWVPGSL